MKHLEHLEHLKILKCSSVKHFKVLNRFKMKIIIFWLNHTAERSYPAFILYECTWLKDLVLQLGNHFRHEGRVRVGKEGH